MLLAMAAAFAGVALVLPEAREEAFGAALVLIAVALFGVPTVVRSFTSFSGDAEVLANGRAGSASITALETTGWRDNRHYPIARFGLRVEAAGMAYPMTVKQAVDPELLRRLAPGVVVGVRVARRNHRKVVTDWREPVRATCEAAVAEPAGGLTRDASRPAHRKPGKPTPTLVGAVLLVFTLFFLVLAFKDWRYEKHGMIVRGTAIAVAVRSQWS